MAPVRRTIGAVARAAAGLTVLTCSLVHLAPPAWAVRGRAGDSVGDLARDFADSRTFDARLALEQADATRRMVAASQATGTPPVTGQAVETPGQPQQTAKVTLSGKKKIAPTGPGQPQQTAKVTLSSKTTVVPTGPGQPQQTAKVTLSGKKKVVPTTPGQPQQTVKMTMSSQSESIPNAAKTTNSP